MQMLQPQRVPDFPSCNHSASSEKLTFLREVLLAVEPQTWCGTAPACRESITHPYGALGDTRYSRDETDTSHPFESNTLHLLPVEHLRNLVATHPAAVGVEWSNHVWDPFFAGLPCQQTGFTFGKQPVLAERYVHAFSLPAVGSLHRML